jgi:hypothetical protein
MKAPLISIGVAVLALDRPDVSLIFLEGVDVHHPVEYHGEKSSTSGVAGFLGGDGSFETELRMRITHLLEMAQRWDAEIHVLVPLRHAEGNALVQLFFG